MPKPKDLYVGNTDKNWFEFCASRPGLSEVNFWQPSPQHFRAIEEGGIFFFRRKSPINKIGGFGILATAEKASIGLLWDDLGEANGVSSEKEFVDLVKSYTGKKIVDRNTQVGFKILVNHVFLSEADWFDVPSDWSKNIVSGKGYSSTSDSGKYLLSKYRELIIKYRKSNQSESTTYEFSEDPPQGGYSVGLTKIRIGQSLFRISVLAAYGNRCAVSGCEVQETLDAAHLNPFRGSQSHAISNGICLRKDIHALFDRGMAIFKPDNTFALTDRFHEVYPNNNDYHQFDGRRVTLPKNKRQWPQF